MIRHASMTRAVGRLPIAMVTNLAELLRRSKRADLWSYAAAEDGEATPDALDFTGGVVLVLGSEGSGIRPLVRQRCDGSAFRCTGRSARSTFPSPRRCCCTRRTDSVVSRPRSPFLTNTCSCSRANAPQRTCVLERTCYVLRHQ